MSDETRVRAQLRPRTGLVTVAPVAKPRAPWWDDRDELTRLWRWLEEQGRQPTDPAYFIEKPYRWQVDYDDMLAEEALPA